MLGSLAEYNGGIFSAGNLLGLVRLNLSVVDFLLPFSLTYDEHTEMMSATYHLNGGILYAFHVQLLLNSCLFCEALGKNMTSHLW